MVNSSITRRLLSPILLLALAAGCSDRTTNAPGETQAVEAPAAKEPSEPVSEAPPANGDRYGIERIVAVLAQATNAVNAGERVLREMTAFSGQREQEDDVCIVAFSRNAE